DAAALAQRDAGMALHPAPHGSLDQGPRCRVTAPAEIALREGIVTCSFDADIETGPERHCSRPPKILLEAREQLAQRQLSADQQPMDVPRLRRADPVGGLRGQ